VVKAPTGGTASTDNRNPTRQQAEGDSGLTTFEEPQEEPKEESSEPSGSGTGRPEPGAKARLFSEGRLSLMMLGVRERLAGEMIVLWLRDSVDDADRVLDAIRRARDAAPPTALSRGSPPP
jgi:hypothetical protein